MRNVIILSSALGLLALGAVSLPGCGDGNTSGSGGSGGSTGVTVDSACKALSAALCGRIDTCAPFLLDNGYGEAATCEDRVGARCVATSDLAGATYAAGDIQACADAYGGQACGDILTGQSPEVCRVAGDKADGATCASSVECKGAHCLIKGEGQCGTCVTPLAAGATCDVMTQVCEAGSYCSAGKTCEKYGAKGAACSPTQPCGGGLSCNGGTCGDMLPEGASCSGGQTCDLSVGLYCNPVSKTCGKLAIAKLGEACGYDQASGVFTGCEADAECDGTTKTCIARLQDGDSCTLDAQTGTSHCATGFQCVAGKCTTGFPSCQ